MVVSYSTFFEIAYKECCWLCQVEHFCPHCHVGAEFKTLKDKSIRIICNFCGGEFRYIVVNEPVLSGYEAREKWDALMYQSRKEEYETKFKKPFKVPLIRTHEEYEELVMKYLGQ